MPLNNRTCYHADSKPPSWLGIALIALGLLIVILCVPLWAWPLILSVALIALGIILLRK